jgi:hypothetical protein
MVLFIITGIHVRLPVLLRRHLRLLFQTKVVGVSYFSGALRPASANPSRFASLYYVLRTTLSPLSLTRRALLPFDPHMFSLFDGQGAVKSAYTCTTAAGDWKKKGGHGRVCLYFHLYLVVSDDVLTTNYHRRSSNWSCLTLRFYR